MPMVSGRSEHLLLSCEIHFFLYFFFLSNCYCLETFSCDFCHDILIIIIDVCVVCVCVSHIKKPNLCYSVVPGTEKAQEGKERLTIDR